MVADSLRADRRRRRRRSCADRRPVRRRLDDDQHEGRAARACEGLREVARGERARRRGRDAVRRGRPRAALRAASSSDSASASAPTGRKSVHTVEPGFRALGAELEPVHSYTDANCMSCGSCLQGCPTNAGKSTLNTYIHDAWAAGRLVLRADARVERVVIEDGEAKGVEYVDGAGTSTRVDAGAVVVAAGTLNTPQLLLRSGLPDSASSRLVGRNLGFHPARLVYRAVRRAAGRAHGVSDHRARDGAPARRGRRLRRRGDDDPGSDRLRDDARGRERAPLGRAARRGPARVSGAGSACS